jgi:hypothetical protein
MEVCVICEFTKMGGSIGITQDKNWDKIEQHHL